MGVLDVQASVVSSIQMQPLILFLIVAKYNNLYQVLTTKSFVNVFVYIPSPSSVHLSKF